MSAKSQVVGQVKGSSGLMRPNFAPGQLLRDDDLKQGVEYTRELSRLLFRTLLGCGVMCGLVVRWTYACDKLSIEIADGVALDCLGDPIKVPSPQKIVIDFKCSDVHAPDYLWVVLRSFKKCCAPRAAACSCDDDEVETVCTREVDWFEIRVLDERPACACGCPPLEDQDEEHGLLRTRCRCVNPLLECYVDHYDGKCGCNCKDCSDCECEWLILARLAYNHDDEHPAWTVDHSVRRFIRPVLISDPQVELENPPPQAAPAAAIADAKNKAVSGGKAKSYAPALAETRDKSPKG
jgi:hypothetical protein